MPEPDDLLLQLSRNPTARGIIDQLGLPVPMPEPLQRATGRRTGPALEGRRILVDAFRGGELAADIVGAVVDAGGHAVVSGDSADELADDIPTDAPGAVETVPDLRSPDALGSIDGIAADATGFDASGDLDDLYDHFHPQLRALANSSRCLLVGRPAPGASAGTAACRQGIEGFTRSLAKELGGYGTTVNLLRVANGAEDRLARPLAFFLGDRSAFVSAQPLRIGFLPDEADPPDDAQRPLKGKTALVTGAARGIGRAIASQFVDDGADVVALDLPDDTLRRTAAELGVVEAGIDLGADSAPEAVADIVREVGGVDIVVNNAGITRDRTLYKMDRDDWTTLLEVNLRAPLRVTEHLLEEELIRDEGRLLFTSSISGIAGNRGQSNYATAKAGFIGAVDFFAGDLADRGITANAIAPGFIETRLTEEMPFAVREGARRMNALSQGGVPEDVANAAAFLASPGASGITGQVLRVCGAALAGA